MILAASAVIRQATRDPVSRPLRASIWAGLNIYAPPVTVLSCWASIMRSISLMADCCNSALTGASFLLAAAHAAAHAASLAAAPAAAHAAAHAAAPAAAHAAALAAAASTCAASIGPVIDGTCLSEVISGRAASASA